MLLCNGLTLGTEMSTHHFYTEVKDNFQNGCGNCSELRNALTDYALKCDFDSKRNSSTCTYNHLFLLIEASYFDLPDRYLCHK